MRISNCVGVVIALGCMPPDICIVGTRRLAMALGLEFDGQALTADIVYKWPKLSAKLLGKRSKL